MKLKNLNMEMRFVTRKKAKNHMASIESGLLNFSKINFKIYVELYISLISNVLL